MALSTYSALQSAVADWLERSDLTSRIPDFIALAEAQMNRVLRVRRMVERAQATITDAYSALPQDFLEEISITLTNSGGVWQLHAAPQEVVNDQSYQASGQPRFYSIVGDEIRYYVPPDSSYTAELTYYTKIPALSDSVTTNWVLQSAPDAYLFGALKEAGPFLKDEAVTSAFEAKFGAAMNTLSEAERPHVGPLRTEISQVVGRQSYDIRRDF